MTGSLRIHSKVGEGGMRGPTLREKIRRERTELKELSKLFAVSCRDLGKAPVEGIVHRDLKLDNIMITREG